MNDDQSIYDYVMASLRAKVAPQRTIARESGVPFSTVCKIAQGAVKDPSVHTIQRLHDYFVARENGQAVPASPVKPSTEEAA